MKNNLTLTNSSLIAVLALFPPLLGFLLWILSWYSISGSGGYDAAVMLFLSLQFYMFAILSLIAVIASISLLISSKCKSWFGITLFVISFITFGVYILLHL